MAKELVTLLHPDRSRVIVPNCKIVGEIRGPADIRLVDGAALTAAR
jgi:hypothetical protein